MKLLEVKGCYAVFELKTKKEQDFFNYDKGLRSNISLIPKYILDWLLLCPPPKIIGYRNNRVAIMLDNSPSCRFYNQPNRALEFLKWLYEKKIIENDVTKDMGDILLSHHELSSSRPSSSNGALASPNTEAEKPAENKQGQQEEKLVADEDKKDETNSDEKGDFCFKPGFLKGRRF